MKANISGNIDQKGAIYVGENCLIAGCVINGMADIKPANAVELENVMIVTPKYFLEHTDEIKKWAEEQQKKD